MKGLALEIFTRFFEYEPDTAYRERSRILFDYLDLQPEESVLDCGSGLGTHAVFLSRAYPKTEVIGMEYDAERVRQASTAGPGVSFLQGSIYTLPFKTGSFDKILCSEVLEHLDFDDDALAELWRVLKNEGSLAISVPYRDYPFRWDPVNKIREFFRLKPLTQGLFSGAWTDHRRLYGPEALKEKLQKAGFQILKLELSSSRCFPFAHFFIYRIGKMFSGDTGDLALQVRFGAKPLSRLSLFYWAIRVFQLFGAEKQRKESGVKSRCINLTVLAKKMEKTDSPENAHG